MVESTKKMSFSGCVRWGEWQSSGLPHHTVVPGLLIGVMQEHEGECRSSTYINAFFLILCPLPKLLFPLGFEHAGLHCLGSEQH